MSIFRQAVNIPVISTNNIANWPANASTGGGIPAGQSIMNGTAVSSVTNQVSFITSGYASGLSFTSTADLSSYVFTIVGTYNGNTITESVVGPKNNTVASNNLFHTVVSIILNVSLPATIVNAFSIGSNYNVAVVLLDRNSSSTVTHPNYTYSVILNSLTATGQLAAGNAIIYGVSNTAPTSLQVSNLTYTTRPNNYFSLPVTGAALSPITQAQLNNGIITQTTYLYAAIVVYLTPTANTAPLYIEITQS